MKYNSNTLAFVLSFLFFSSCFINTNVFAQSSNKNGTTKRDTNRIVRTNWVNSMGLIGSETCIQLLEDNLLLFVLKSRFTDPDIAKYPDMHFWYSYTLPYPIHPLVIYNLTDKLTTVHPSGFKNGKQIWEVRHTVEIDLVDLCDILKDSFNIEFKFQFVTKPTPTSVHMPYPYLPFPGMFPPDLFDIPQGGFSKEWTKEKRICCFQAGQQNSHNNLNVQDNSSNHFTANDLAKTNTLEEKKQKESQGLVQKIKLFPNPFNASIKVNYFVQEAVKLRLSCTNAMGEELLVKNLEHDYSGDYEALIDTASFPPGLYFFRLSSSRIDEVIKVIKLVN